MKRRELRKPMPRAWMAIAAAVVWAGMCAASSAQSLPDTMPPAQQAQPADTGADLAATQNKPLKNDDDGKAALPAARILEILQANPQAMVEVKAMVAALPENAALPAEADVLSDEELFRQIVSSGELRAGITYFLEARGYVTEQEVEEAARVSAENAGQPAEKGTENTLPGMLPPEFAQTPNFASADTRKMGAPETRERPGPETQNGTAGNAPSRSEPTAPGITDKPDELHRPAPYNLRSLRDLYTQVPEPPEHLKRFGSEVFLNRAPALEGASRQGAMPLDVPLGPDYVLGPGDELGIDIWGGVSQTLLREVDREGRVMLPEAGDVEVAGISLGNAEKLIGSALGRQFRNAHVSVTVARLRTIRVYVVGDVQRPGAYDINSLSSPLGALYAAGGPTAGGSLRVLRHYRNRQLIGEIDLYDFLLHGVRAADDRLEGGDTLLVPPVGAQVAVFGAVKRPAIYELRDEKTLGAVLDAAGGLTVAAALSHITVDRIVANQRREEVTPGDDSRGDAAAAQARVTEFAVEDGDRVRVAPVLPYSERAVYVEGHVTRPGKRAYRDGMQLSDVLRGYADLLPEPASAGEVVRLVAPDLHPETIDFDVPEVLIGNFNLALQPFDTIRVFGRYERDPPTVSVRGEVVRPGTYPLFGGMTAAQLVRAAGGFNRSALLDDADLISYQIVNGDEVKTERRSLRIGDAVTRNDRNADAPLKAGDVLTIHQITGWNDIGASIVIEGEVAHPGSYGFREGERLSDVLKRAGGLRASAYPEGAVLIRPEVRVLEEKSREELIRQIETTSAAARLSPGVAGSDQQATMQLIDQQQQQVLTRLRTQPASGRLVIHIEGSIDAWAGTAADIEVRSGDVLRIPKRPGFVLISGQVYNASAISFVPGKTAGWYLQRAGGATQIANRKEIFVVRANGSVVGRRSSDWYDRDVLSTRLNPGDVIVVPQKIIGASLVWRNLLGTAQVAASLAIAAAVTGL